MIWIWLWSWFQVFCSVLVTQVSEEILHSPFPLIFSRLWRSLIVSHGTGAETLSRQALGQHTMVTGAHHSSALEAESKEGCGAEGRSSPPVGGAPPGWSIQRTRRLARLLGEALLRDSTALGGVSALSLPSGGLPVPRNEAESASWTIFLLRISRVWWASWWVEITITCG